MYIYMFCLLSFSFPYCNYEFVSCVFPFKLFSKGVHKVNLFYLIRYSKTTVNQSHKADAGVK